MTTPNDQQAIDLVLAILEANRAHYAQPATLYAIARKALDARAAAERERAKDWRPIEPKPADWDTEYQVTLTGKNLEAMHYLARFVLDKVRDPHPLPFGVIASADHLFCLAAAIRALD